MLVFQVTLPPYIPEVSPPGTIYVGSRLKAGSIHEAETRGWGFPAANEAKIFMRTMSILPVRQIPCDYTRFPHYIIKNEHVCIHIRLRSMT